MAKKKGKEESTGSNTDISEELSSPQATNFLGKRNLRRKDKPEPDALLRISDRHLSQEFLTELGIRGPLKIGGQKEVFVVLGPFEFSEIRKWIEGGFVKMSDQILRGYDRWKSCKTYFPDLAFENTNSELTHTQTASASGMSFEEDTNAGIGSEGRSLTPTPSKLEEELLNASSVPNSYEDLGLEVEEVAPTETWNKTADPMQRPQKQQQNQDPRPANYNTTSGANMGAAVNSQRPMARQPIRISGGVSESPFDRRTVSQQSDSFFKQYANYLWPLLVLIAFVGLYLFMKGQPKSGENPKPPLPESRSAENLNDPQEKFVYGISSSNPLWPEKLRPITNMNELFSEEKDPVVNRVRRVLISYQYGGSRLLSPDEMSTLTTQQAPGSASAVAQLLAANQLAVYYLASKDPVPAVRILKDVVQDNSADLATHVNLAIAHWEMNEYDKAQEQTSQALQYAQRETPYRWLALAMNAIVSTRVTMGARKESVDKDFSEIEKNHSNDLIYWGLRIKALQNTASVSKSEIQKALMSALWVDPDRMIDCSFESVPLARYWFVDQAFDALIAASKAPDSKVSAGQRDFLELLKQNHSLLHPFKRVYSESLLEKLDQERANDPLSQLLYAYLLKEDEKYLEASNAIEILHKDPEKNPYLTQSSYPHSFAGDLAIVTGQKKLAEIHYSQASDLNRDDVTMFLGSGLLARENGDYAKATAMLSRAHEIDSTFIPAMLRTDRFSWQRMSSLPSH